MGELAQAIGALPPLRLPIWSVRLVAPFMAAAWLDTTMRVSNKKAKEELQWMPRFPSYHQGIAEFAAGLGNQRRRDVSASAVDIEHKIAGDRTTQSNH